MITLGDAIRLGALNRPQAFGPWGWPDESCALQAALDAVGETRLRKEQNRIGLDYMVAPKQWPWITEIHVEVCPLSSTCDIYLAIKRAVAGRSDAYTTIIHLNDYHHKSRQWIAEWVDSVDPTRTANQERMITTTQQIEREMAASLSSS